MFYIVMWTRTRNKTLVYLHEKSKWKHLCSLTWEKNNFSLFSDCSSVHVYFLYTSHFALVLQRLFHYSYDSNLLYDFIFFYVSLELNNLRVTILLVQSYSQRNNCTKRKYYLDENTCSCIVDMLFFFLFFSSSK